MATYKQQYRKIKQEIFSKHNPIKGVISFFEAESITTIKKFEVSLSKEDFFIQYLSSSFFPDTLSSLNKIKPIPRFQAIEKTLLWYSIFLKMGAVKINEFLEIKSKFDHAFLWGEYMTCQNLLDECHKKFGLSLWEIKKRIAVLSELNEVDGQKKYTKEVLSELERGSVLYYAISNFVKQYEKSLTLSAYQNALFHDYNHFISQKVPVNFCKYACYKSNGFRVLGEENKDFSNPKLINYFLLLDCNESLIDRYLSFRSISAIVFSLKSELGNLFLPYISTLAAQIDDTFLTNIVFFEENGYCKFHSDGNNRICQALDYYSRGQYEESRKVAAELLKESIIFFPVVELYAKNCIYYPEHIPISTQGAMIDIILSKLRKLFSRQGDILEVQAALLKTISIHLDAAWANELLAIIERHNNQLTVLEDTKTSNLFTSVSTPNDIFLSSYEHLDDYLEKAPPAYRNWLSTQLVVAIRRKDIKTIEALPIDPIRKGKYEASILIEQEPIRALELLDDLASNLDIGPVLMEINAMRVRANLQTGNLLKAMQIFVPAYSENSNFIYIGYIDQIFEAIKGNSYEAGSSILASIICSLYFKFRPEHDDRDDVILSICYSDYLISCGVRRPSELLKNPPDGVTEADLIRFLAEVCVPNVMDRSIVFSSNDEVLCERRDICQALIKLDPIYKERYENEIQRLSKNLLFSLVKQEVNSGKIFIDEDGIRTRLGKELCESYERFVDFQASDMDERVNQFLKARNNTAYIQDNFQNSGTFLRSEQPSEMLWDIIRQTRNIYVADNKYGLDGCLSVRIRHGTLESRLRSCFEKHKLITSKMADGTYRKNEFWYKSNSRSSVCNKSIDSAFSKFAFDIDKIILHLKKDLIQIKTEEKNPEGLFDFSIDANLVARIASNIRKSTSFETYEGIMLDILSNMTSAGLAAVRNTLKNDINTSFQNCLKDLEAELKQHNRKALDFRGLSDQIAMARTDISTELQVISEWFRLAQPNSIEEYSPSVAISLAFDNMQKSHTGLELHCDQSGIDESIRLKGSTFSNFLDIFDIILDNAIRHSGFSDNVSVKINIFLKDNFMHINANNFVKPGYMDQERIHNLEILLRDWEQKGYVNREGGSGLHKIKKILTVDLKCKNKISISGKNNVFCLNIIAECGGILI